MFLAEIDADGWVKIIGAIGLIVMSYFQWRMWMQLHGVSENVQKIEKQTNSLTQQLVDKTDKSANQAGRLEERARADAVDAAKVVALAVVEAEKEAKIIDVLGKPVETIAEDIAKVQETVDEKKEN